MSHPNPRSYRLRRAFLPMALATMAAPALAAGFADPAEIDRAVAQFTGLPIGVPGGALLPVDRRLRLAACTGPLALSWRGGGHDSVLVQCPDAGGWRLFVAVAAQARQDEAPAVLRGDAVTIAASGEGFTVSQPGEALDNGAVGSWVRVRTGSKADPMRARVIRPGLVELPVD